MGLTTKQKVLSGVTGSALLFFGTATAVGAPSSEEPKKDVDPLGVQHTDNGNTIVADWLDEAETPYVKLANHEGEFVFNQEGITPNDELFNIFGATLTSMCSKPASELMDEGGIANYYINVGGNVKKNFTIDLSEISEDESEEMLMACSCATGSPFGQASVLGVPLAKVIEMADLEPGVNTITAYGADGYGMPIPLQYAVEHRAMLVYQINGETIETAADGSSVQLWMPETVAQYFTRNIVDIELTSEEVEPEVASVDPMYRNKINILNYSEGCVFQTGHEITFEGVADDLGSPICAIEFSFDGGKTWTSCETTGATADKWVNWQFTTSFDEPGDYRMTVRAKTADNVVSPLAATLYFEVA